MYGKDTATRPGSQGSALRSLQCKHDAAAQENREQVLRCDRNELEEGIEPNEYNDARGSHQKRLALCLRGVHQ